MKKVVECSQAIAEAVNLCRPGVVPIYPITPQTHVVEEIAKLINDGKLDAELICTESEHSMLSAAIGAEATGVRTFTATSSQGLAFAFEMFFIASGLRLPIVAAVVNRTLSAPINIWNDWQDSISARDSGWIQLYVENSQEAFDSVIQAYKIAEDKKILLPVMVCLDGFILSHVNEPVEFLTEKQVKEFLPDYKPLYKLDPESPITMGPVAFPDSFIHFKKQQQDAMENALQVIKNVNREFKIKFGRSYGDGLIETYKLKDAKHALITMGSVCGTSKVVIDELRKHGKKVGLIKIKCFRPFPKKELIAVTKCIKEISVIDKDVSIGSEGALYTEVRDALYDSKSKIKIMGFIAGLGGKDITTEDIKKILLCKISNKGKTSKTGGWVL